ncbi:MAG: hypothetical protein ACI883_000980, partial [Candidatus Azotimanducaceae bacterium]
VASEATPIVAVSVARPFCSSESDILIFLLVNKSVAQLGFKISQVRNPEP